MPEPLTKYTIARRLRQLRLHAGLTQDQLGQMLHVTQQVVSQREMDGLLYLHQWPLWSRALRCGPLTIYETSAEGFHVRGKRAVNWLLQDYFEALPEDEQTTVLQDLRLRAQRAAQETLVS